MARFLMLGRYTSGGVKGIAASRTKKGEAAIKKCGGRINSMYVLLGNYDLAFIVDFPGIKEALKASVALTKLTGIGFVTFPAISVKEFDKIAG